MATPQMNDETRDESSTRLVWVLNSDAKPYKGTFEGATVVIPARNEKIALPHYKGGNLFPHTGARQFITDYKEPQEWVMDRGGKMQPIFGPKALREEELTIEEFESLVGKTKTQLKKEFKAEEKEAQRKLSTALDARPNKIALEDEDE